LLSNIIRSENDTSNFGNYSATDDHLVLPIKEKDDPFLNW